MTPFFPSNPLSQFTMKIMLSKLTRIVLLISLLITARFATQAESVSLAPQYFVAFPPGLNPALATNLLLRCLELITTVPAESSLTFLQAIEFGEIATVIAAGDPDEIRLMDESVSRAVLQLRKFLLAGSTAETKFRGQLQLPRLIDEIGARRLPGRNAVLVLVGDPRLESVYPAEKSWSMQAGLVPSDGTLRTPYPQTPWGVQGRSLLRGTTIHWLTDRRDWMMSSVHEERVKRFLHLWFKLQGSEGLCSFFGDAQRVFDNAAHQASLPVVHAQLSSDLSVAMWSDPHPPTLSTNDRSGGPIRLMVNTPAPTVRPGPPNIPSLPTAPDLAGVMNQKVDLLFAGLATNQMGIASVWFSEDAQADVDFWVRPHRTPPDDEKSEIRFSQTNVVGGHLLHDLTRSFLGSETPEFTSASWEGVILDDPRLDEATIWLNVFKTSKPVTGLLRALWRGKSVDIPFRFDVTQGDKAGGRNHREDSPCWFRINLRDQFPTPQPGAPSRLTDVTAF